MAIVAGGEYDNTDILDSVETYGPSTSWQWVEMNPLPGPRLYAAIASVDNRIILMGDPAQVLEYDPSADAWNAVGSATTSGRGFVAIPYNY